MMDNVEDIYPLTPAQAGILYHTLRERDPALYFEQVRSEISGDLDPNRLRAAWQHVTDRHPAMRTIFVWTDLDDPLQVVRTDVEVSWREVDLRHLDPSSMDDGLDELCLAERQLGVTLTKAPISRFVLVRTADDVWHFVWNFHHIALDGWSTVSVFGEAFAFYRDGDLGSGPAPPFRDHLAWLAGQDPEASAAYWRSSLAGFEAPTPLRLGTGEPDGSTDAVVSHTVDLETSQRLGDFAVASRVTLNTLIQAAWAVVLCRYSGDDDVVFGVTISGRPADLDGVEDIAGMFLNTLPMRLRPPDHGTVREWLKSIQLQQQDINTHQHSSLAEIQRLSDLRPGDSLFDSIVIFENYPTVDLVTSDTIVVERRAVFEQSHYPLTLMAGGVGELSFTVLYDRAKFGSVMVAQLLRHLENALVAIVDSAEATGVSAPTPMRLEILSEQEQTTILETWNDTTVDLGPDATIDELFGLRAAASPDATALIYGRDTMSYAELDVASNRLANYLCEHGVGPEVPVGISMYRSFEMVVAVLATVKAGGVYVPLDPTYPLERTTLIAGDAALPLILTHTRAKSSVPDCGAAVVVVDEQNLDQWSADPPPAVSSPDCSALITFTSGSTGRPKGVQAHHRGIVNRIRWQWKKYPLGPSEVTCQKTTLNFVDHLWELWGSLLAGTPQVLVPEDVVLDTPRFLELLAEHEIQRIVLVPSYIRALLDAHPDLAARLPKLRYWTFSGEGVSRALADRFRSEMPHAVLLNFYGMSEVTLDATFYDDRWGIECETVPIGRPIANHRVYLLDRLGRVAPVGAIADIHVSGVGLSRGYWQKQELTDERFISHSFIEGERLYLTGDRGRWLPSGDLEYLGRSDSQVKVRGNRVEVREVEATIGSCPGIGDCVVVADEHLGYTRLLAYVIVSGIGPGGVGTGAVGTGAVDTDDSAERDSTVAAAVTAHVRAALPAYMVPAAVMVLDEFPRTPNGKLDRLALRTPSETTAAPSGVAATEDEAKMLRLWSETLEMAVGLDDDFFDAGGHSLIAIRLVSRIAREFDEELPLAAFFEAATPRELTALLAGETTTSEWVHLVPISSANNQRRPNLFCVHGAGGDVLNFHPLGRHLEGEWSLVGIQAAGVDGLCAPHRSMDEFCDAYIEEILAYQPEGPYLFAGYSAGGVIAYEIACRLVATGCDVLAVVLLDTFHPGLIPARVPTLRRSLSILAAGPGVVINRLNEERARRRAVRGLGAVGNNGESEERAPLESRGAQLRLNTVEALSGFTPSQHEGYVLLCAAQRISWIFERAGKFRGWQGVATNLDYQEIPGRHTDLVIGSNAPELAGLISGRLEDRLAEFQRTR